MDQEALTAYSLNSNIQYALTEEIYNIKRWARALKPTSVSVMIGCGPAVFGLALVEGTQRPTQLWIIDKDPNMFHYAEQHFSAANLYPGVMDSIHFIEGDSAAVGNDWQTEVDFLLVDGDHSEEGVTRDIDAWLPRVKRRGVVWFHDFLERPGGFNGVADWEEGGCAIAVSRAIADGRLMVLKHVGISIVCERL